MKKIALVVVVIVTMAMVVGGQTALAAKPDPVTGIANGKVTAFGVNTLDYFPTDPPSAPPDAGNAKGSWKIVAHDPTGTPIFNLSATCQVEGVVYKLSYKGPGTLDMPNGAATITIPEIEVKNGGVRKVYKKGTTIIIDANLMTLNINSSANINMEGTVKLAKFAPSP